MAVKEMSGFLKYKDSNGDTILLFPITTKDNIDGLDEIENELANAVKITAQTLTDDQKAQARENINAVSGWSEIEDKPFGELPTGSGTLYWDGNREGRTYVDNGSGSKYYFISESTPTMDDFANGGSYTSMSNSGESSTNIGLGTSIYEVGDGAIVAGKTYVALKDGATMGDVTFPKKGTYFVWIGTNAYTTSLTIPGYNGFPSEKLIDTKWLPPHDHKLGPTPVTTSGTGAEYTATIDGVTELYAGLQLVMLPHTNSTTTSVKLNLNGLGAKMIRQRLSTNTTISVAGATANWIVANKPITVTYNGSYWIAELTRPDANTIYGTVKVENGGVPSYSDAAEGAFLRIVDGVPTWVTIASAEEVGF